MATIDPNSKIAYMYDSETDKWYAIGAGINTAGSYQWTGVNTFNAPVYIIDGPNHFENPNHRDTQIPNPNEGAMCVVFQENNGGATINQLQIYRNGQWVEFFSEHISSHHNKTEFVNSSTNYTIGLSDAGKTILFDTSSTDITVTIPLNNSVAFPKGSRLDIIRNGSNDLIVSPASGVILNSKYNNRYISVPYTGATLIKTTDSNTWILIGDLTSDSMVYPD